MIESAWQCDYGVDGRKLWKQMLYDHDAEMATKAVAKLSERQRARPMVADLRQMLSHLKADMQDRFPGIPAPQYGTKPPDWVWVWAWCRHMRAPRHYLPFPQQLPYVDETQVITREAYDELYEEWVAAGSPKLRSLWDGVTKAA